MRVKRAESECPKAFDPAERLAMDGKAGGSNKAQGFRHGWLLWHPYVATPLGKRLVRTFRTNRGEGDCRAVG
ncbi:MAG: hypothetical protein DHS20C11_25550 [Lysobacteraceae bacterium]|nr:MAG: hypothetical protein DHS20C11_25550 [Xanthomonadaceae bacterium]